MQHAAAAICKKYASAALLGASLVGPALQKMISTPAQPPACARDAAPCGDVEAQACAQASLEEKDECVICFNEFKQGDAIKELPCLHKCFHEACIDTWLHRDASCPLCKQRLVRGCVLRIGSACICMGWPGAGAIKGGIGACSKASTSGRLERHVGCCTHVSCSACPACVAATPACSSAVHTVFLACPCRCGRDRSF